MPFACPPANLLVDLGHLFSSLKSSPFRMDKVQQRSAIDEGSNSYWFECLPSVHGPTLGGNSPAGAHIQTQTHRHRHTDTDAHTHTVFLPAEWFCLGCTFCLPLCTRDCPCIIKYLLWERKELLDYYNIQAEQAGSEQLYWQLNAINKCVVSLRPWFSPS